MRLLINVSSIGPRSTGMGVYAAHHARFLRSSFDCDIVAAEGADAFGPALLRAPAAHALGVGGGAAIKRWLWAKRQERLPGRVMYSPTHHSIRKADKEIITIHDLISLRFARQHPLQHLYFKHVLPIELKRVAAVFTVSETSRQDIHEQYGFPLDRIRIVPNGVDTRLFRPSPHKHRKGFLLVVGAAHSHKNVEELLRNSHLWRHRYQLVIASCRGAYRKQLMQVVRDQKLVRQTRFIDYASLAELIDLYQTCAAYITASRWEGFGIPLLEAMACGARVIASDIPAHREVLDGHERLVQLGYEASWASAFTWLEQTAGAPRNLRGTPVERYSWERAGRILVDHLLEVEPSLAHSLKTKWTESVGKIA
jgi:glycosyltransferase involved in cell wall biosynthesis